MRLLKYELLKTWCSRLFIGALLILTALNIFLLWYNERPSNDTPPNSAYSKLHNDISGKTEQQKLNYINGEYDKLNGFVIIEQLNMFKAQRQNDFTKGQIAQLESDNADIIKKYETEYKRGNNLKYTSSLQAELNFITVQHDEITKVENYNNYLKDISEKAKILTGISIFAQSQNNDDFSSRNIQITAKDYGLMSNTKITFDVSKGFTTATEFVVTDIIAIFLMFVIAAILIFDEKDKGLFSIIKPTADGRAGTILAKIGALSINMLIITLLLFGSNLIYMSMTTGLGDLSRSVQSIGMFMGSTLQVNVLEYLTIFLCTKFVAYFTVALVIVLISIFAKHPSITYLTATIIFIISIVPYSFIAATSYLNIFKYINLVSFVRTNTLFEMYLNLNFFSNPVNLITASFVTIIFIFVLLFIANVISFCKKKMLQSGNPPFKKLLDKIRIFRYKPSASVFRHEGYKLLIVNKAAFFIILFIIFQVYSTKDSKLYLSINDCYYKNYMTVLQGSIKPDKEIFLTDEQKKFSDAHAKIATIDALVERGKLTEQQAQAVEAPFVDILAPEQAFKDVLQKYNYVKSHPGTQFVYDTGYNKLFGITPNNDTIADLKLIVMCILCFVAMFSMEYKNGAVRIIGTTPLGRAYTANLKITICIITIIPFFIANYILDLLLINNYYGFSGLLSSISSLQNFSHWPMFISILGYMIIMYLLRFIAGIIAVMVVLAISLKIKKVVYAMLVASLLVITPVILSMLGLKFLYNVSLIPIMSANPVLMGGRSTIEILINCLIPILAGLFSIFYIKRKFCKS
jgi:hypothetical protein